MIVGRRGESQNESADRIVTTLLTELDGIMDQSMITDPVIVIAGIWIVHIVHPYILPA